jgi:hypothetical protein
MNSPGHVPGGGRGRRRLTVSILAAIAVVVIALVVALVVSGNKHNQVSPPTTLPINTTNAFLVSGTRILGPHNQPFVPYGIVVFGLSNPDWATSVHGDLTKIHAIATAWHANTVRLQVAPNYLVSGGQTKQFEAALKKEVSYARSLNLVVIISAQTEHSGAIPMPNAMVEQFWKVVAPLYSSDAAVWYDLFNEPRMKGASSGRLWNVWQNGGGGVVGMQSLVDTIRASANNIILAEGLHFARTLKGLEPHLLKGSNIVYEVHSFFVKPNHVTPSEWTSDWGYLTSTVPLLVGAWSQYENGHGDCVQNAVTLVPTFLSYVRAHGVGLIGWALSPGVLIRGNNPTQPTTITGTYSCTGAADKTDPQGAGQDLMTFFEQNARPAPALG